MLRMEPRSYFDIFSSSAPGFAPNHTLQRIDAPTPYVWVIGRIQTNGERDFEAVHEVQEGFTLRPLDPTREGGAKPPLDPSVDMETPPMVQLDRMQAPEFFSYAAGALL